MSRRREEQTFLLVAILIGVYSGLSVVTFRLTIDWVRLTLFGSSLDGHEIRRARQHRGRDLCLGPHAEQMYAVQGGKQLGVVVGPVGGLHLATGGREQRHAVGVDVLEQEGTHDGSSPETGFSSPS